MFHVGSDILTMVATINNEIAKVNEWLKANKLSLNVDKTNFMLFSPRNRNIPIIDIKIDGNSIERVYETKFLGVIIDENLSWGPHIRYIKNKISKSIGIILKGRKVFDTEILLSLYNTLVYPYLSYCIQVWGSAYNSLLSNLIKLQKRIIRIISGVPPQTHSEPLFKTLNVLTVKNLYNYSVALFMYKYVNLMLPPIFTMFTVNSAIHAYNTRSSQKFHVPHCHTRRSQKTIRYTGVTLWNYLTDKLNSSCKIGTFKFHLKTYLIQNQVSINL